MAATSWDWTFTSQRPERRIVQLLEKDLEDRVPGHGFTLAFRSDTMPLEDLARDVHDIWQTPVVGWLTGPTGACPHACTLEAIYPSPGRYTLHDVCAGSAWSLHSEGEGDQSAVRIGGAILQTDSGWRLWTVCVYVHHHNVRCAWKGQGFIPRLQDAVGMVHSAITWAFSDVIVGDTLGPPIPTVVFDDNSASCFPAWAGRLEASPDIVRPQKYDVPLACSGLSMSHESLQEWLALPDVRDDSATGGGLGSPVSVRVGGGTVAGIPGSGKFTQLLKFALSSHQTSKDSSGPGWEGLAPFPCPHTTVFVIPRETFDKRAAQVASLLAGEDGIIPWVCLDTIDDWRHATWAEVAAARVLLVCDDILKSSAVEDEILARYWNVAKLPNAVRGAVMHLVNADVGAAGAALDNAQHLWVESTWTVPNHDDVVTTDAVQARGYPLRYFSVGGRRLFAAQLQARRDALLSGFARFCETLPPRWSSVTHRPDLAACCFRRLVMMDAMPSNQRRVRRLVASSKWAVVSDAPCTPVTVVLQKQATLLDVVPGVLDGGPYPAALMSCPDIQRVLHQRSCWMALRPSRSSILTVVDALQPTRLERALGSFCTPTRPLDPARITDTLDHVFTGSPDECCEQVTALALWRALEATIRVMCGTGDGARAPVSDENSEDDGNAESEAETEGEELDDVDVEAAVAMFAHDVPGLVSILGLEVEDEEFSDGPSSEGNNGMESGTQGDQDEEDEDYDGSTEADTQGVHDVPMDAGASVLVPDLSGLVRRVLSATKGGPLPVCTTCLMDAACAMMSCGHLSCGVCLSACMSTSGRCPRCAAQYTYGADTMFVIQAAVPALAGTEGATAADRWLRDLPPPVQDFATVLCADDRLPSMATWMFVHLAECQYHHRRAVVVIPQFDVDDACKALEAVRTTHARRTPTDITLWPLATDKECLAMSSACHVVVSMHTIKRGLFWAPNVGTVLVPFPLPDVHMESIVRQCEGRVPLPVRSCAYPSCDLVC